MSQQQRFTKDLKKNWRGLNYYMTRLEIAEFSKKLHQELGISYRRISRAVYEAFGVAISEKNDFGMDSRRT